MIYFLIYNALLILFLPFYIIYYFVLSFKNREYLYVLLQNFSLNYKSKIFCNLPKKSIWLHAASVGEVQALKPLIDKLLNSAQYKIIVSTMTITGQEQVKKLFSNKVLSLYKPYDLALFTTLSIKQLKPDIFIIMETELWPNIIRSIKKAKVPLYLINARLSNKSMKSYKKIAKLIRPSIESFDFIFTQSSKDTENFLHLGAKKEITKNIGNIKYDISPPKNINEINQDIKKILYHNHSEEDINKKRPTWIAASTHNNEEELLFGVHKKIQKLKSNALLIIAPRHPERFKSVIQLCKKQNIKYITRSSKKNCSPATEVFILDSLGELIYFYKLAQIAFIGGSLTPIGGHNPLEAIAVNTPVVWGPHMFNFAEIKTLLLKYKLGKEITNTTEIEEIVLQSLSSSKEKNNAEFTRFLKLHSGAIEHIYKIINKRLCS